MSVSFKRPVLPYLVTRGGEVRDRESGVLLGVVRRDVRFAPPRWNYATAGGKAGPLEFGYTIREQAVAALVSQARGSSETR